MEKTTNKNPFANPDGTAKIGEERNFLKWHSDKEAERRKKLPEAEQKRLVAMDKAFQKRIDSEHN